VSKKSLPNCTAKQHNMKARRKSHATAQRRNVIEVVMATRIWNFFAKKRPKEKEDFERYLESVPAFHPDR